MGVGGGVKSSQPTTAPPTEKPTLKPHTHKNPAKQPDDSLLLLEGVPEQCTLCKKPLLCEDAGDEPQPVVCNMAGYFHLACFVCGKCKKSITSRYVPRDGIPYHTECAYEHTCSVCDKPVRSRYLEMHKKVVHVECFVCTQCNKVLADLGFKYIESNSKPYCVDCMRT